MKNSNVLLGYIKLKDECLGFVTITDNGEVSTSELKTIANQSSYTIDDEEDGNLITLELINRSNC